MVGLTPWNGIVEEKREEFIKEVPCNLERKSIKGHSVKRRLCGESARPWEVF